MDRAGKIPLAAGIAVDLASASAVVAGHRRTFDENKFAAAAAADKTMCSIEVVVVAAAAKKWEWREKNSLGSYYC